MNTRLLFLVGALALPSAAAAQAQQAPLDELFACQEITDAGTRLACLDAAVTALRNETATGDVIAIHRGEVEAAEEATYGLSIPGFRLPSLPRFSLPGTSGNADDLVAAELATESSSAASEHVVVRDADGQIDRINNLEIASLQFNRARRAVVTLANGQVWQQIDADSTHVSPRISPEDGASIRNAALSSYMMRIGENGRWFRVRRTQ